MKNYLYILLFLLFLISGAILRFIALYDYPAGFFRDEAALGYNAYSIWKTGGDEYGIFFPLVFRSFEVFFLPAYIYLSAGIIGILGLSEFSTRFLSAISGTLALILIYLIALELWKEKKIALAAMFILTIAPWHIFYSRGAFEGNLALTIFSAGFLFWLKFLDSEKNKLPGVLNPRYSRPSGSTSLFAASLHPWTKSPRFSGSSNKFFFLSILFFALSMYCYQSERLIVPLLGIAAIFYSFKPLLPISKKLILPALTVLIILLPLLSLTFQAGGYHRAVGVSIFSDKRDAPGWINGTGLLINNEFYLRIRQVSALYLSYFSPRNLFSEGDSDQQRSVEKFSVFYSFMLPFLFIGIISLVTSRKKTIGEKLILIWIVLAPIPATLTTDPFHTYRSLMLYLPLSILIGLGIFKSLEHFKKYRLISIFAIGFISMINLSLFLYSYFVLTPATRASFWDYGYREIVSFINSQTGYGEIRVDDPTTEAYIHFLFFGKTDPKFYHSEVKKFIDPNKYYYNNAQIIRPPGFAKFVFKTVDWPKERGDVNTIFVFKGERLPPSEFETDPNIKLLKEIYYPNGKIAFRIVKIIKVSED